MPQNHIRRAHVTEVTAIKSLIDRQVTKNLMLPRALNEIYQNLRDFFVYFRDDRVVGCVALHIVWENLAEVRSLAVEEDYRGLGLGKYLVERAVEDARELSIPRVFALTYVPDFFEKLGFRRIDKMELPHQVWADCVKCHKFPDCGEIPLVLDLDK
ncbi:MAG TPA: N-acetyltransferase [bacterium]|nr:N-acetyltransferase [bacterium]